MLIFALVGFLNRLITGHSPDDGFTQGIGSYEGATPIWSLPWWAWWELPIDALVIFLVILPLYYVLYWAPRFIYLYTKYHKSWPYKPKFHWRECI